MIKITKENRIWYGLATTGVVTFLACANPSGASFPTTKDPVVTTAVTTPEGIGENVAQKNARLKAESYLSTQQFSRVGLLKQLQFEGYSAEDAQYGVDATKADWTKQAEGKAQSYMRTGHFSRKGLIDQLKFEGFEDNEAEHGAAFVGL
jgi:hypothetical protein